jgi:hypothetical protein
MNWIKSLWDKLVNSTSTSPTIVLAEEVEEEPTEEKHESAEELMKQILLEARVSEATIESLDILNLFKEWYEGAPDEEEIRASIQDFKEAMGGAINAKLNKVK